MDAKKLAKVMEFVQLGMWMVEIVMGNGTGEQKKEWVMNWVNNVLHDILANEAQDGETWAQILLMLDTAYPEPVPVEEEEEPEQQSFLGKIIDVLAGLIFGN